MASFVAIQHDQFLHWETNEINITQLHLYTKSLFLLIIICSLILAFIFFYAHRVCHYRHQVSTAAATTTTNAVIPRTLPTFGLDPSIISSLPVTLHLSWVKSNVDNTKTRAYMQTECPICLGVFEDEDKLKVLPECNHAYHSDCLDKWLSSHSSCPLCRASLDLYSLPEIAIPLDTITEN
ncbi:hypothetical protein ACOSP7_025161 [Xanthoceras sorbifolium]|uniref:RING-type E3 ubiquitin transferase n=1 Tax=Xanthoceras sorbifolium TaxID=99658 RepID=A0ABQ8H7G4_9ROSI|nr:hypothetical protein JRO89_XS13G0095800 [Xanthoceras sorbifolium]